MKQYLSLAGFAIALGLIWQSCKPDKPQINVSGPTLLALEYPDHFTAPNIPADNPTTEEGVQLGRKLFYDPILSGDNTQSCSNCHNVDFAFTDNALQFSIGIDKMAGNRNSMPIINLAWDKLFFWDGRAHSLEEQALGPVENLIEMHETWANAVNELQNNATYPDLFNSAFGTPTITKELVAKAIAQFERTLISGYSVFDYMYLATGQVNAAINTPQNAVERGMKLFYGKADCWHCHGNVGDFLFTDRQFHNNGLDSISTDPGLAGITKNPFDHGKFKTPTLRNLAFSAPYMHDGRFKTIEAVIEHYNSGVKNSPTLDPNMKELAKGLQLTDTEKAELKEFLLTLSDNQFINNINFKKP